MLPVIISLPNLDGKIEQFKVFSFPVLAKILLINISWVLMWEQVLKIQANI
jgi:hypothetical protein